MLKEENKNRKLEQEEKEELKKEVRKEGGRKWGTWTR